MISRMTTMKTLYFVMPVLAFWLLISACEQHGRANRAKESISDVKLQNLWADLMHVDQSNRSRTSDPELDLANMINAIELIKTYDWPRKEWDLRLRVAPNFIFRHQRSPYVKTYLFPLIQREWEGGNVDTSLFLMNLEELFKDRYGRQLIRGRKANIGDISHYQNSLDLNRAPSFDTSEIRRLALKYDKEQSLLEKAKVRGRWIDDDSTQIIIYEQGKTLMLQKIYVDRSLSTPQEMIWDSTSMQLTYKEEIGFDDFFTIQKSNVLIESLLGRPTKIYKPKFRK